MFKDNKNTCKYFTYDTKSESNCFNASWTIMEYSKLPTEKEYELKLTHRTLFDFKLIFRKDKHDLKLWIENNDNKKERALSLITTIIDEDGKELYRRNSTTPYEYYESKTYLVSDIGPLYKVLDSLRNDIVTFNVEFWVKTIQTWETFKEKALRDFKHENKLSKDLIKLILENHPMELFFQTADGTQIKANEAVMAARSVKLKEIISYTTRGPRDIHMEEFTNATVRIIVDFLNTDEAPDLSKIEFSCLEELYMCANKFEILDLRKICAGYILHGLTKETMYEGLVLAANNSDEYLKKGCFLFIRRHIASILNTKEWKSFRYVNPDLGDEIFEFCCKGTTNGVSSSKL